MERDILVEVNHPFIVKLHYGESTGGQSEPSGPSPFLAAALTWISVCSHQPFRRRGSST